MAEWRLSYPGMMFEFGSRESGYGFVGAPELGIPEDLLADVTRANDDGMQFGVDRLGGTTITFVMDVYRSSEEAARTALAIARQAWRADRIRTLPGAVAELSSGQGRSTFGRPRRFSSEDTQIANGYTSVLAEFSTATDLWFGDEQIDQIRFAPSEGGGTLWPLTWPIAWAAPADRSQVIRIGGDMPTQHVQFEITGPITNPMIDVLGVSQLEFRTTLAYDEVLVVNAVPWVRTITVGGKSRAGVLTPASTPMRLLELPPGDHEIVLRGTDQTGTATLTTIWRDAYATP